MGLKEAEAFLRDPMATRLRELLEAGPFPGEDFYRLKVTGNGETHWMNVSPDQLAAIARVLSTTTEEEN